MRTLPAMSGRKLRNDFKPSRTVLETKTVLADDLLARRLEIDVGAVVLATVHLGKADDTIISVAHAFFPEARAPGLLPALRREKSITEALKAVGVSSYNRKWTQITARMPTKWGQRVLLIDENQPLLVNENVDVLDNSHPIKYTNSSIVAGHFSFYLEYPPAV